MAHRVYQKSEVASFFRTSELFGPFSNMNSRFPFKIAGMNIPSTENYYQAMRFPHLPDFQAEILAEKKPMMSKRLTYKRSKESRADWLDVNIAIMRQSLRLKYGHYAREMQDLFKKADGMSIVEISSRDPFWGTLEKNGVLTGNNILGRLLMELREEVKDHDPSTPFEVIAPDIPNLILCGVEIETFTPHIIIPEQASLSL